MKVALLIEVPDEFLAGRAAEMAAELGGDPDPRALLLDRLQDVADDELPLALFGWPCTITVKEEQ